MKKSTSIHRINGDLDLNIFLKILYLQLNIFNNLFPNLKKDNEIEISNFTVDDLDLYWEKTNVKSSPSRKLSDLFFMNLPWEQIKIELNDINVLDIGCGSGIYGIKLSEFSSFNLNQYIGIDIKYNDNWNRLSKDHRNFNFIQAAADDIREYIPENTNLIISQSALEHIDNDLLLFYNIKEFIEKYKKNIIQIHLVPSAVCLRNYLWHGFRQYNYRTICSILRLFKNSNSYCKIYNLGGNNCSKLHFNFITKPRLFSKSIDLRDEKTDEYNLRIKEAIKKDMNKNSRDHSFYAFIMHSYFNNKIF